jgi:hypothetical protein
VRFLKGIPTPQQRQTRNGAKRKWTKREADFWSDSQPGKILNDERYTGKQIFGKMRVAEVGRNNKRQAVPKDEWVVILGAIPAIITEEQYNKVREIVSSRYHCDYRRPDSTLLFSKKLRCGHCGIAMRVIRRKDGNKYKCATLKLNTGLD